MKNINIISFYRLSFLLLIVFATSCSKDDDTTNASDEVKTAMINQYVDNVVTGTYKSLADQSQILYQSCTDLYNNPDQAHVALTCQAWINARQYWELSEAFLFGAVKDYSIDPHIDSWPLDKSQLELALQNGNLITNMKENGCNFSGFNTLGYGLLGFHAIEYMVFRDGTARKINGGIDTDGVEYGMLSEAELVYCKAVAEDLRNQCYRLEASWAGIENVSPAKQTVLDEAELEPAMNYGTAMKEAGKQGNTLYKTQLAAMVQMIQASADIADEVGNTKITDPVNSGNVLDVESWYSWNSITDFANNIRGIQNVYKGSLSGTTSENSLSQYIASLDSKLNSELDAAIVSAITEIEAMPAPFRNHLTVSETAKAKAACNTLLDKLQRVIEKIQE